MVRCCETLRVDCLHDSAVIEGAAKDFELLARNIVAQVDELHAKAAVGFVAAVSADRIAERSVRSNGVVMSMSCAPL